MGAKTRHRVGSAAKKAVPANFPGPGVVLPNATKSSSGDAEGRAQPARLDEEQLSSLVERARSGHQSAFEEIVRVMQGPVRAFTRRMMRDQHLGDDAAQETFLRMWKGLQRLEPRGRFVAWSFTVARNTCIELLRKEKRTPAPMEATDSAGENPFSRTSPADLADTHALRRVVGDAVASLDEPFRSTILLRETGMAYEELSEVMGCPVGTIRSRLHEARRRLADSLRPIMEEAL